MNINQIGLLVLVVAVIALLYFVGSSVSLWMVPGWDCSILSSCGSGKYRPK
jgi:hypothetical protein